MTGYKFYRDTSCTGWPMGNDYPPMFYHSLEEAIVKCNSITRCGCIRAPFCTSVNGSGVWFTLYYGVEFDETDIPECTLVRIQTIILAIMSRLKRLEQLHSLTLDVSYSIFYPSGEIISSLQAFSRSFTEKQTPLRDSLLISRACPLF